MPNLYGQPSFTLQTRSVRAALARQGAMLAPVTFFADSATPVQPYAIAPWATEPPPPGLLPLLAALRGDFMCSAFGDNVETFRGVRVPPHGDTANQDWTLVDSRAASEGTSLRLRTDMPNQGGRCVAMTTLLTGHNFVYQRHDFEGVAGPINPGHHALLACPTTALLSFSRYVLVGSSPARSTLPPGTARSRLTPGEIGTTLSALKCLDGSLMDVTAFPTVSGTDDVFLVCSDPTPPLAWSAATFPGLRYAWLALRNPRQLASTLVWLSNGGRLEPPWNGRHGPVLGMEDMTGYFASGLNESARSNLLNARGIPTCLRAEPHVPLRIPYIQGVVRIPADFDRIASIEPLPRSELLIQSESGIAVRTACRWEFLQEGVIAGLCEDEAER